MVLDKTTEIPGWEEKLQRLQGLCLLDDVMMRLFFAERIEETQLMLQAILGRDDIQVVEVVCESVIVNVYGHGVRIDIKAKDQDEKLYGFEIQKASEGAVPERARFQNSLLDTRQLKEGENYLELRDSYTIFITEKDELGEGLPIYHIHRYVDETTQPFGDGSHIIYVNCAYDIENGKNRENTSQGLLDLIHDFRCKDAGEMRHEKLAKRMRFFKENEEGGKKSMSGIIEELRREMREEMREEVKAEMREEMREEITSEVIYEGIVGGEINPGFGAKKLGCTVEELLNRMRQAGLLPKEPTLV